MPSVPHYATDVQLWLVVDGAGEVPVRDIKLRFAVNSIPTATVTLSTGVDAANPSTRSKAHELGQKLYRGMSVKMYVQLTGQAGPDQTWPGTPIMIFDGFISSAAPQIGNGLGVSIGLVHWLDKLDSTHWLNSLMDPASAENTYRPYGFRGQATATVNSDVQWKFSAYQDFWVGAIKPVLLEVARSTSKQSQFSAQIGRVHESGYIKNLVGYEAPNAAAAAVLERMDDAKHIAISPLPLLSQAGVNAAVIRDFDAGLGHILWNQEGSPTLWSKMLRIAGATMCAIVPTVETAAFVPWVPALDRHWLEIPAKELWSLSPNAKLPRGLRGVILMNDIPAVFGISAGRVPGVVGFYDIAADPAIPASLVGDNPGQFLTQKAHPWLTPHLGGDMLRSLSRNALGPPQASQMGDQRAATQAKTAYKEAFANQLAKAIYMAEVFKFRPLAAVTRLRFDVCPGSTVRIVGGNPDFDVPGYTAEGCLASVSIVHVTISADEGCRTVLELSHLRLAHETCFSLSDNPFFQTSWAGSPLVNIPGVTPSF